MQIRLKGYGTLVQHIPPGNVLRLEPSGRVTDVLDSLGLSGKEVWLVVLNRSVATLERELHDGDLVELIPPIGGG